MFKRGFILNYYSGAKGDFLLRFIANIQHDFTEFGKTTNLNRFNAIRSLMNPYILSDSVRENSKKITEMILSQPTIWPYASHWLYRLDPLDVEMILLKFKDTYDLIVDENSQKEVVVNLIFKNYNRLIPEDEKQILRKRFGEFKGEYSVDRMYLECTNDLDIDFTDDLRINFIKDQINLNTYNLIGLLEKYACLQKASTTKKIFYSKTFYPPYEDLIKIYRDFNGRDPDIYKLESLLPKSFVPKEMNYFNHRISVDLSKDLIMKILRKN